ncbi:MAG: single-stranded-DNA-specific exonuclease RecJ [Candidatus Lambdaproteobacteria bacterium RIFOXYD1_FULL_56_27]|uniref:Single-stranded-DNA-specific exonuclease RecJ n=1 Tax=Candidatus Lambdaproteobacteria bacterium RIFOXYD2_FULL_56_26 TaxID=1817773 RepID=A0A1F6GUI4_9PROT|nr:MAG: single-stranded-DNA-specific exonuclease RecJ [Candidatus Lambdaproteobacteria bacterium RIFOXYC1_FULL_56_13]OGH01813.1 MAG: single-stranded-DNA-specific exonuclease RecJ [Candidatus Lambdaproteobacteria bacterium RIFOXYD2_FULL_56_26]OGH07525.1 MAG: single-stranded-DNA-specific exonuclease RecJ [Candidatus Lambdaproteobacteria bacterium RIFOXYD1_FULL_56_27]
MNGGPLSAKTPLAGWFEPHSGPWVAQFLTHWLGQLGQSDPSRFFQPKLQEIPDPFLLKGMALGVELLGQTLLAGKKVLVLGDYDVDGVTGTALLLRFLTQIGFEPDWMIPNRFGEGYGLTQKVVGRLIERAPDLVVTVDNGVAARTEVAQLEKAGIKVLVTDHHQWVPEQSPVGLVINPKQPGCLFPEKEVSGVGVAFLLLMGLRKYLRDRGFWGLSKEPNLLENLDLVALGTVADQVPLVGLNRLFTQQGLEQMHRKLMEPGCFGAFTYLKVFAAQSQLARINAETLGFRLGPLLNAAGRMEDASLALRFLVSPDEPTARHLLGELERLNGMRKKKQVQMLKKAKELAYAQKGNSQALLVFDPEFHEGLLGLVASRLVEEFGLPVLVGTLGEEGQVKCSGRSPDLDLVALLESCQGLLTRFGGHAKAAGCQLEPQKLAELQTRLAQNAATGPLAAGPRLAADLELNWQMIGPELTGGLKRLEPFGQGNPKPVFLVQNLRLGQPRVMGQNHLKWELRPGVELIRWEGAAEGMGPGEYQLAVTLGENHFNGKVSLQGVIEKYFQTA